MDPARFKRRETPRRRTANIASGVADIVPQASAVRPQINLPTPVTPKPVAPPEPVNIAVQTPQTRVEEAGYQEAVVPHLMDSDMELPGQPSLLNSEKLMIRGHGGRRRLNGARLWALRGVVAMLVLVIGTGGILFSQGYFKLHKVFHGGVATAAALKTNVNPNLLKGEGDGRVNVLLLGRGGGNHDGPDLTDTMMLASVDPVNHKATLISIPRDLWVDIPNQGAMKINAAWETGEFKYLGKVAPGSTDPNAITAGFTQVDQTVENILGVTIDYNALIDFSAFKQAVDTVNGVTVNVPTDLIDPTMAWENHGSSILAKAGVQNFDGKQALIYVRSRETTSDFARAQRQRSVMVALKSKVDTLGTLSNPLKIAGLMDAFGNNVSTDLSLSDASRLYGILKDINNADITSVGMADAPNHYITTGNMNGQSIDQPTAGLFNYGAIQEFVRSQLKDPYLVRENARVLVLNGTQTPNLAANVGAKLTSYGYNVIGAGDAPGNNWSQTTLVDLSHGKDKYTLHYLQQRYNVTATTTLPDPSMQTNGADFVIIVGSDEASTL